MDAFFGTVVFNADGNLQLDISSDRALQTRAVDLSSAWETSGSLTLTAGTNTLRLTPNDTADPYASWNEAASTIAAFYAAVGRTARAFTLTLDDGALPDAAAPSVSINAIPAGREGTTVKLSATLGDDGTHDGAVEYAWKVSGGALDDATLAEPTLTRPQVSSASDFTADLTITARGTGTNAKDGTSDTASAVQVAFRVTDTPTATTVVASAGDDKTVASGGKVTLDGSAVVTNGVGATTYAWTRVSGAGGALSSATAAKPEFTAPVLARGTADREIVWRITATNNGVSDTDDVTVTVTAPPAFAAPNFADDTGDPVTWTEDTAIAAVVVPAASGNPAPTYAAVGALPDGIKFDIAKQEISGTPTTAGTGTITIRATNSQGSDDWTLAYEIEEAPEPVVARLTIGNPGTLFSSFARWVLAPGTKVPAGLMANGVAQDVERLEFFVSRRQIGFRVGGGTGAGELTPKWEKNNPALIVRAGSLSVALPGPDNETVGARDASEPYTWVLPAGDNRLSAFIAAYRGLSTAVRNGTQLILADGEFRELYTVGPLAGAAGTPKGTAAGTVVEEPRYSVRTDGKAGRPSGTLQGRVEDEPQDEITVEGKAGTPTGTFRSVLEQRNRYTVQPITGAAGDPDGGTIRMVAEDDFPETIRTDGKAGTPSGTLQGRVEDEPQDKITIAGAAGSPAIESMQGTIVEEPRESISLAGAAGKPTGATRGTITEEPRESISLAGAAGTPRAITVAGIIDEEGRYIIATVEASAGEPSGDFRGEVGPAPSEDRPVVGTPDGRPFLVDWARPVDEAYQFRTEIIRSYRGIEQRIAQRTVPRITHTYEGWLDRSGMRQLARTLEVRQGFLDIHIPHARDSAALSAAVAAGSSNAPFAEGPPWAGHAEQIFLVDGERSEVVRAGNYSGGEMATSEFRYAHPAGTRAFRMVRGYFTDGTRIAAQARHAGRVRVELQEDVRDAWHDPVFEIRPDENPEIDGLEYLGLGPNWSRPVQIEYLQARQELDFTRGPVDRIYPEGPHTDRTQRSEFLIRNETHLNQVLGLFYRCRGAQMPFYMDSLLDTLTVVEDIGAGEDRVLFRGTELAEDYDDLTAYRRFRVRGAGLDQVQEVQSVTAIGGNSLVVTADPFRASAAAKDIGYAAWVVRSRFETDLLTLRWETSRVARAQVTTRLLEDA